MRSRGAPPASRIHRIPGKHFLQEDHLPALTELITAPAVMAWRDQASAWGEASDGGIAALVIRCASNRGGRETQWAASAKDRSGSTVSARPPRRR